MARSNQESGCGCLLLIAAVGLIALLVNLAEAIGKLPEETRILVWFVVIGVSLTILAVIGVGFLIVLLAERFSEIGSKVSELEQHLNDGRKSDDE